MMNSRKLKVLQLSTFDITGGASVACLRGHESLRKLDVDSMVGVKFARGDIEGVKECHLLPSLKHLWKYQRAKATLNSYRRTRPWGAELFSSPYSNSRIALKGFANPDLIHFHWITNFIDLRDVVMRFSRVLKK
jgi:hypothetical protein